MRNHITIILLLLISVTTRAQNAIDSLQGILKDASNDSSRYTANRALYNYYEERNRDSAWFYGDQSASLARKNGKPLNEAFCLNIKGYQLIHLGHYAAALQCILQAFEILDNIKDGVEESWALSSYPSPGNSRKLVLSLSEHMYAILMEQTQNVEKQILHFKEARSIAAEIGNKYRMLLGSMNLGNSYLLINKLDSAMLFIREAEQISVTSGLNKYRGYIYSIIGDVYLEKGDRETAKKYFYEGLDWATKENTNSSIIRSNARLLNYYMGTSEKDSVLHYALKNLEVIREMGAITSFRNNIGTAYEQLATSYKLNNEFDSAFKYQGLALVTKDSLYKGRIQSLAEFQNVSFTEQRKFQEMKQEKVDYRNKIRTWAMLGGLAIVLIIALMLFRNNRQKNKSNKILSSTLDDLKATQTQLIQSEKMASLGELTAGIAHEIQNPLNFVNNFSEVNKELLTEMNEEIEKGNFNEVKTIAKDVTENEGKIIYHGKRADAIVKGMLQHSRSSSGQKEPTDINALADEYLRLAYHGLRAKDKTFNATTKTDYDNSIGTVNIIPQDIGRVILNLITNAFYAVTEKKKQQESGYEPTVTVSTKKENGTVLVKVKDNGNGIPQKVLDKIFQPFFTTKPTGQGTGLGLSLSYDIIKAHGEEIKVVTKENEGTEFIIQLPATSKQ
ncbi:MAG TPA: ATP-binding protein [Chitinophagaceae bacterium]|jgi:signal transduction histidine kinase|nr:ATP-binding protein [Chitinophagaceae bacterium]